MSHFPGPHDYVNDMIRIYNLQEEIEQWKTQAEHYKNLYETNSSNNDNTKRPISSGAEEILDLYFPVLDAGFVSLVDYMGTDTSIESAARVSYGAGTRKVNETKGLLRYLKRHLHTTPYEMVELKFHCCMPIFVARQWIRHRTACLSGDVEIYFSDGNKQTISEFYRNWRAGNRKNNVINKLSESTKEIVSTEIVDIWSNGKKPIFKVTLENGYSIKMTKDHLCYTESGWLTLEQAVFLRVMDDKPFKGESYEPKAVWNSYGPKFGVVASSIYDGGAKHWFTYSKVRHIEYVSEEEVFDIEVDGTFHNFIANGFVVHNSVNEFSGRYSLMPLLFYTPPPEQFKTQSKSNNQGRGSTVDYQKYHAAVDHWNKLRKQSAKLYEDLVAEDVARELARIDLPLSTYTQWYWKIDLHNLFHFLTLRVDSHAQWEIQQYGKIMAGMLKKVAPLAYEAWIDYDVCGAKFSRMERLALEEFCRTGKMSEERLVELGLSKREIIEYMEKTSKIPEAPDFELDLSQAKPPEYFEKIMAAAVPKIDKNG